ncbi:glutamate-ammonia-ligase adenylyltransferase [Rhodobium orientis]|uniref:Bifunctional glutamine synthetase adenylyltransferase/adenylyl-removing enzyme n=1 Tax=Rhodobium orientis TaxID=34017 RepID=A0A327JK38_9HYPH|nr:bifunctional [glutamine synthetase] adenylyltransferase/[glutamine synthetase]-adenylyl-L-tyrosine phosphorylase [Rhodobium orientis]MBB4305060.1 glutamate-ammonia-ligase adenylyltransferase [Rhodobium orientis]MBK5949888.1 bifunctional glutamine synthetase adenylyltransferase/deadenyltransferase [Rhodobium orientis]RAI25653.1 bifunctional glutamine synthetase adenylyltransferase/deadenyltransferase [Rhodobium orientis]
MADTGATGNETPRDGGPLAGRIAATVPPADAEVAEGLVADLRARAGAADGGEAVIGLIESEPALATFLGAVFSNAPYLRDITLKDPASLGVILAAEPAGFIAGLVDEALAPVEDEASLMARLRRIKAKAALAIAVADLGGAWSVVEVTRALSDIADAALKATVRFLFRDYARQGKVEGLNEDDPEAGCGYVVLAMGKHGARELNYSSDIDLIILYAADRAPLKDRSDAATFFVRLTKRLVKIMQERTADGYVFRVDLRLRPDPGATPVAISLPAALTYYESMGQNWERAALIKARAAAGDRVAGDGFLAEIAPFIWRKYLDYAAIADIQSIKRQIHAHKGFAAIGVAGHNVKVGHGGIREVEFFVQTQQLIAGGRNMSLRGKRTLEMLDELVHLGWVDASTRDELAAAYTFLRRVEHRIQMVNDEQTQLLPEEEGALMRVVRLSGYADLDAFARDLRHHLETVRGHYAELFEAEQQLSGSLGNLVFTGDDDDPGTLETLAGIGFKQPREVIRAIRAWHYGRYPAMRSTRAREALTELTPALLEALAATENADAAFRAFDEMVSRLPAGVQLFSMLHSNPNMLGLMAIILGAAPRLGQTIARRPRVLGAVLDPAFFGTVPSGKEIAGRVTDFLAEAGDYEERLNRARIIGQEQMFLIGVRVLTGTLSASQAGDAFATLAGVLVRTLLAEATAEIERAHGTFSGARVALLALGKLGGSEMTAASDLDLMLLYDIDGDTRESDGRRGLAPSQYYARLTQRLIAALSAPTPEGTLYEVDMRLRPSGNAGPLATHVAAFERYQAKDAWTWEHMALTRAAVIGGDTAFGDRVRSCIDEVLVRERDPAMLAAEVAAMRFRIEKEKGTNDPWDIKQVAGGLVDIEFIAQYLQLAFGRTHPEILARNTLTALKNALRAGVLGAGDAEVLIPAITLYQDLTQILRLAISGPFKAEDAPLGLKEVLAKAAGLPEFARLEVHLRETEAEVRSVFEHLVGPVIRPEEG